MATILEYDQATVVPLGGGWVVGDFIYDGEILTGFSPQGKAKLQDGNTELYLPKKSNTGQIVTKIKGRAFYTKSLTAIKGDWGNIISIGDYAFSLNLLTSIPRIWENIKYIGRGAFSNNRLTMLPDSWENVTSIGKYAFFDNLLTSIPDNWRMVTNIKKGAFCNNQLDTLPDSWGNVTNVGKYAFDDNRFTEKHLTELACAWVKFRSPGLDKSGLILTKRGKPGEEND